MNATKINLFPDIQEMFGLAGDLSRKINHLFLDGQFLHGPDSVPEDMRGLPGTLESMREFLAGLYGLDCLECEKPAYARIVVAADGPGDFVSDLRAVLGTLPKALVHPRCKEHIKGARFGQRVCPCGRKVRYTGDLSGSFLDVEDHLDDRLETAYVRGRFWLCDQCANEMMDIDTMVEDDEDAALIDPDYGPHGIRPALEQARVLNDLDSRLPVFSIMAESFGGQIIALLLDDLEQNRQEVLASVGPGSRRRAIDALEEWVDRLSDSVAENSRRHNTLGRTRRAIRVLMKAEPAMLVAPNDVLLARKEQGRKVWEELKREAELLKIGQEAIWRLREDHRTAGHIIGHAAD